MTGKRAEEVKWAVNRNISEARKRGVGSAAHAAAVIPLRVNADPRARHNLLGHFWHGEGRVWNDPPWGWDTV